MPQNLPQNPSKISGLKRKALLIFKSERTLGAKNIVSSYTNKSFASMKEHIITENDVDLENIIDKTRIKDLTSHLNKVKKEFIGQSELSYYHATLIILIRREYKTKDVYEEFERLWEHEYSFLLKHLNLRWIISACDTFVDHATHPTRSAILMNAVTLINTLKVYETEQYLRGFQQANDIDDDNVSSLYAKHLTLYDGLTYFRIGADDTLKNMRKRYEGYKQVDRLASIILLHIFDKIQNLDTAFALVKSLHRDEKSQWW